MKKISLLITIISIQLNFNSTINAYTNKEWVGIILSFPVAMLPIIGQKYASEFSQKKKSYDPIHFNDLGKTDKERLINGNKIVTEREKELSKLKHLSIAFFAASAPFIYIIKKLLS